MRGKRALLLSVAVLIVIAALAWLAPRGSGEKVVVYTSVDSQYAKALEERFEKETGIPVELKTDAEISKTTGLLSELRQRKASPDGDVFWNSEQSGTLLLAREGFFEPYLSPQAASIPARFKDPAGLWTGFGCRARVLIFNTRKVKREEAPRTLWELAEPRWRGRFCLARPLFGTTRSHLTALVLALGEEKGWAFLKRLRENGSAGEAKKVWVLSGNAEVRDRVAEGWFDLGLTDTDDVYEAQTHGKPVDLIFCEQTPDWPGVFLIPNTVAVINRCPHPQAARKFVDFLLSVESEAWLAAQGARQIPVRTETPTPPGQPRLADFTPTAVDLKRLTDELEPLSKRIDDFLRGLDGPAL